MMLGVGIIAFFTCLAMATIFLNRRDRENKKNDSTRV